MKESLGRHSCPLGDTVVPCSLEGSSGNVEWGWVYTWAELFPLAGLGWLVPFQPSPQTWPLFQMDI